MDKFVQGCLSCDIVSGRRIEPGGVIYEDAHWHVGSAVGPAVWRGFLVIKLKRHCEHLAELTPAESTTLGPLIRITCQALTEVLRPAKIYSCSFGEGTRHVHFWALPRPQGMRPGMHAVMFNLDMRLALTRWLGIKKWLVADQEMDDIAVRLRESFRRLLQDGTPG